MSSPQSQTPDDVAQRYALGAIDQMSFAVRDVVEAAPRYAAMFGGPFHLLDVPPMDVLVRGVPTSSQLRLGFGRNGDLEVELVQVLAGDHPSLPWLDAHGEGLHHVRFPVSDLKATQAAMVADGAVVTLEGSSGALLFSYLESPLLAGMTIELIQLPDAAL